MFQSTPSGGKATHRRSGQRVRQAFQSTPSGGKATHILDQLAHRYLVSIHAFRGEGDRSVGQHRRRQIVSIHAFRGEGDVWILGTNRFASRFNPRLPGGRRLTHCARLRRRRSFNPRLPGGRRHAWRSRRRLRRGVSIHAFRGEGDRVYLDLYCVVKAFQSTPSGGKATSGTCVPTSII